MLYLPEPPAWHLLQTLDVDMMLNYQDSKLFVAYLQVFLFHFQFSNILIMKQVVLVGEMENTKFYQILLNFTIQFGHQLGHLKI